MPFLRAETDVSHHPGLPPLTRSGRKLGLKGVWINRPGARIGVRGQEDFDPDWTFASMTEFADAVRDALGGKRVEASPEDKRNLSLTNEEEACKPHFPLSTAC